MRTLSWAGGWRAVAIAVVLAIGGAGALPVAAQQQVKSSIVESGTNTEGSLPVKYTVTVIERAIPTGPIVNDFTLYGEKMVQASHSVTYHYLGIDGRTLHISKITREGQRESERLPILLPLANDDTAILLIETFSRRTPFSLRLKKNADNSITVTVVK